MAVSSTKLNSEYLSLFIEVSWL